MRGYAKALSVFFLLAAAAGAKAQQQMGPGGPPGGPDGGPPDPQQMQQMMEDHIKQNLAITDDAWTTLQPMVDKVLKLAHDTDTGPMMHGHPHHDDQDNGDGQGPPDADDEHPHSAVETATTALKKVLADKSASDDKIQTAMKAVQDAEKKAKDDLDQARKSLRAAVNIRQQAVLVAMGVLN